MGIKIMGGRGEIGNLKNKKEKKKIIRALRTNSQRVSARRGSQNAKEPSAFLFFFVSIKACQAFGGE